MQRAVSHGKLSAEGFTYTWTAVMNKYLSRSWEDRNIWTLDLDYDGFTPLKMSLKTTSEHSRCMKTIIEFHKTMEIENSVGH